MAIWYILWSFGIFSPFCYVVPRKIQQPCFSAATMLEQIAVVNSGANTTTFEFTEENVMFSTLARLPVAL
jgi:hypothetical protein